MKRFATLIALCQLAIIPVFARDFLPAYFIEDSPAANGSTVRSLAFPTTPGVSYEIERSEDLVTWETVAETYGLGQTFAHPIREMAAPPPPDPNATGTTFHSPIIACLSAV